MARTRGEIVLGRPVEEIFDFVADERNVYDPRVVRAEKLTPGPVGAGTRFRTETKAIGRTVPMTVEITAYERPSQLASRTRLTAMEIEATTRFESVQDGTRVRWHWEVRPRGALRLVGPIVAWISRRQARVVWGSLKRALEGG